MAQATPEEIVPPELDNEKALDQRLQTLQDNKQSWAALPLAEKIAMAKRLLENSAKVARRQVMSAARAKSIPLDSPLVGEEWLGGPTIVIRNLRLLIETLEELESSGAPSTDDFTLTTTPEGQTIVKVFPASHWDKLLFTGFTAEVWMEEGVEPDNLSENMAGFYRNPDPQGKVALVLGAGNVASIGTLDVVYKLFVEGQVCILKMNPVNDYLGPFIEAAFAEFIDRGFVQMAYGGVDVGAYLCSHDQVEEIHITGSDRTHDAIVYGVGQEGQARKERDEPRTDKRITSELGNVSPVIVVPGKWSDSDLRFHAENLASQIANNGGFNCNAARVIITHEGWDQRQDFLDHLRTVLAEIAPRDAYYPGASDRFEKFVQYGDKAESFGLHDEDHLPWTVLFDIDPEDTSHICFTTEAFCGVKCETALPAPDTAAFLRRAAAFCNENIWGTLSASIIVDPKTATNFSAEVQEAIAALRYGSIVINHWPALSYGLGVTTWGAFPGHTYQDIQSGIGVVHNTYLFDRPQKSVVRGPFRVFPKPAWFVTNKNTHRIGEQLTRFEENPSFLRFVRVVKEAVKG